MSEQITYDDKELYKASSLPDNQKWTFEDANDVKSVVNSHATDIESLDSDKLSTVSVDGTTITGDGTTSDPLVSISVASYAYGTVLPTTPTEGALFWHTTDEILYMYQTDGTVYWWMDISSAITPTSSSSFSLTDGNGTTANGNGVDLGGSLDGDVTLFGEDYSMSLGSYSNPLTRFYVYTNGGATLIQSLDNVDTNVYTEFTTDYTSGATMVSRTSSNTNATLAVLPNGTVSREGTYDDSVSGEIFTFSEGWTSTTGIYELTSSIDSEVSTYGLKIDPTTGVESTKVYFHTSYINISNSDGIEISDSGLLGAVYNSDYSALGILNDLWLLDWGTSKKYLGGNALGTTVITPTATEDGYSLVWDNTSLSYILAEVNSNLVLTNGLGTVVGSDLTSIDLNILDTTVSGSQISIKIDSGGTNILYWDSSDVSTDLITEGTFNLYYTENRFDTSLAAKTTTDISEGTNLYYTTTRANADFDASFALLSTDDLTEGVTNLYYTSTRFDVDFAAKDTDDLIEGITNLYYSSTLFDTDLATKTTDDIIEGTTNLYNQFPTGGTSGQIIEKIDGSDYNTQWIDANYASIDLSSTRIIEGAVISINASDDTTFDLSSGSAEYWDYTTINSPIKYAYEWTAQTSLIVTNLATYDKTALSITHDNTTRSGITFANSFTGTVNGVSSTLYIAEKVVSDAVFDPEERRIYPYIGRVTHFSNTNIFDANNLQGVGYAPYSFATEIYRYIAPSNFSGNEYASNTGTDTVVKSSGVVFAENANVSTNGNNPNFPDSDQVASVSFLGRYYNLTDFTRTFIGTSFPFDTYNDVTTGTLESLPNNKWAAHRVYLFADSNNSVIQYGQKEYSSYETAIEDLENVSFTTDSDLTTNAIFRGWFVVKGSETITDGGDWFWVAPSSSESGQSSSASLTTLQTAYDASIDKSESPEMTIQDVLNAGVTIKDSFTNVNRDTIFHVLDNSDNELINIDRNGTSLTGNLAVNSNTLYVDSTSEMVGIHNSAPTEKLQIGSDFATDASYLLIETGTGLTSGIKLEPFGGTEWELSANGTSFNINSGVSSLFQIGSTGILISDYIAQYDSELTLVNRTDIPYLGYIADNFALSTDLAAYLPLTGGDVTGALSVAEGLTLTEQTTAGTTLFVGRNTGESSIEAVAADSGDNWMMIDGNVANSGSMRLNGYSSGSVAIASGGGFVMIGSTSISTGTLNVNNTQSTPAIYIPRNDNDSLPALEFGEMANGSMMIHASNKDITLSAEGNGTMANVTRQDIIIDNGGQVGINGKNTTYQFYVDGTAGKSSGTAWVNTSDIRLKDVQGTYEYGLNEICALDVIRYNYKEGNELKLDSTLNKVGFSAQQVQDIIPDAVSTDNKGYLNLDVDPIHWAMVNAIKELNNKVNELTEKLNNK